jgi:hypothetical protein
MIFSDISFRSRFFLLGQDIAEKKLLYHLFEEVSKEIDGRNRKLKNRNN